MPTQIGEIIGLITLTLWQIFKATWWILLPIYLLSRVQPLYLRYKKTQYLEKIDWVLLEISLPPEVEKTPKAMENVLEGFHGSWSPPTARERWTEGAIVDQFSLEMVGIHGELHFYVRCKRKQRNFIESKIYAQYPDAEIYEASDYTRDLPAEVPGPDYELWGADYILNRKWVYPIRTYIEFEDIEEERRMDPISQFAELVGKMEQGEHIWMQIVISPVLTETQYDKAAQKEVDKLAGRESGGNYVDPLTKLFNAFSGGTGSSSQSEKKDDQYKLMNLTPGEKAKIEKIEIKDSKVKFKTSMRSVYIARKEAWHSEHIAGLQGYLRQFTAINGFRPDPASFPKSSFVFFKKTRNYMRKRNILSAYKSRFLGNTSAPYILNTEELATIYHFPGKVVRAPFMPRVSSRTSEPPRGLPT
ncbi:MAG: hypothetical protein R3251_03525 [Candidatus Spechtbacterales bacterium]|nr:hypothetical protein [Candidatus Spechtbacterales bacterium]